MKLSILLLTAFMLFSVQQIRAALDQDPKMILPNNESRWRLGYKQLIAWNSSYEDSEYYNNLTRVNVALFMLGNGTRSGRDELLATVIQNFPLTAGNLYWSLPANISEDASRNQTDYDENLYYLKVYPAFFDWPGQCKGCRDRAPISQLFRILPQNCQDCAGIVDPQSPGFEVPHNYNVAVKSVSIAVGVVALLVLLISVLIYTKKGMKRFESYRRRQSGMIYKYRPPSVAKLDQNGGNQYFPSPLRQFFSSDNQVVMGGASPVHPQQSPKRAESLQNMRDHMVMDAGLAAHLASHAMDERVVLDLPPSPPDLYTRHPALRKQFRSDPAMSASYNGNEVNGHLFHPAASDADTRRHSGILNKTDAVLVGSTFRHALRVNEQQSDNSASSEQDDSSSYENSVSTYSYSESCSSYATPEVSNYPPNPNNIQPPAPLGSAPRFMHLSMASSPVLGRLAAIDSQDEAFH